MNHFELHGGIVHVEDVALPLIARAVGTPLFVYSTATRRYSPPETTSAPSPLAASVASTASTARLGLALTANAISGSSSADSAACKCSATRACLMRPSLYDAWHQIEAVAPRGQTIVADIVGPVCETGDIFARARAIDAVEAGDLLIIRTAGAYAATMASTYNSRPLAAEVLVDGSDWAVVRKRQDVQALIDGDTVPDWLRRTVD